MKLWNYIVFFVVIIGIVTAFFFIDANKDDNYCEIDLEEILSDSNISEDCLEQLGEDCSLLNPICILCEEKDSRCKRIYWDYR